MNFLLRFKILVITKPFLAITLILLSNVFWLLVKTSPMAIAMEQPNEPNEPRDTRLGARLKDAADNLDTEEMNRILETYRGITDPVILARVRAIIYSTAQNIPDEYR
jgi:hypothetical protein